MHKRILLLGLAIAVATVAVWALFHFNLVYWQRHSADVGGSENTRTNDSWAEAVEKVKADRGELAGGTSAVVTPPELRHYSDRYWFLATQVAEIDKYNVPTCQDFVDLAAMIERGQMVSVPAVTETYVLYGVGEKADERPFGRYQDDKSIDLYDEAQLSDAYKRLAETRLKVQAEIAALKRQSGGRKKRDRTQQNELQKQIAARQEELNSTDEDKALLDQFYGQPHSRQKLFRDYDALRALAKNLVGRSFNIDNSSDRQAMKVNMLSSLRPEALKIMEEVASVYHRQFDRPLPVSSLVRPEQYQRTLNRMNRNAVLIDTPPHSTGLAFDINYRYMSAAEQTFLMAELARLKNAGRIEVIRERSANYHVFVFINGTRPGDDLITASLEKAGAPVQDAHHGATKPRDAKSKTQRVKSKTGRSKIGRRR